MSSDRRLRCFPRRHEGNARGWALHRSARCASLPCPSLAFLSLSWKAPEGGAVGRLGRRLRRFVQWFHPSRAYRTTSGLITAKGGSPGLNLWGSSKLPNLQTSKLPLVRPACGSTPLICSKSAKSAVSSFWQSSCAFVELRVLRVSPAGQTSHMLPLPPPVARLSCVLFSLLKE